MKRKLFEIEHRKGTSEVKTYDTNTYQHQSPSYDPQSPNYNEYGTNSPIYDQDWTNIPLTSKADEKKEKRRKTSETKASVAGKAQEDPSDLNLTENMEENAGTNLFSADSSSLAHRTTGWR